jgi:hypothetical protein
MQKSLSGKDYLSEYMQIEDYKDLSFFKKLIFWMDYPFSYRYLQVIIWDRFNRLNIKNGQQNA